MKMFTRLGMSAAIAAASAAAFAGTAGAVQLPPGFGTGAGNVVFVQNDNLPSNQIFAYDRAANGTLTLAGTYGTDGLGGVLTGSVVDHVASQGSLTYDPTDDSLYAVNAGLNTISVFLVHGDQLYLRQIVHMAGTFPVSIAVHGSWVYVLGAENGGSVEGFSESAGVLTPLAGSSRSLGLNAASTPQFTNTPGQVAFSPSGNQLIVTTKANGNDIDVFGVEPTGYLSPSAVVNAEPKTVPFGIDFDPAGHLVVAEAGTNALATFNLNPDGTVSPLYQVATGQAATCWVTNGDGFFFASNAGSPSESSYTVASNGSLHLIGNTTTDPGAVDAAVSADQHYLYVQTGGTGVVDEFAITSAGSLTKIGSVTVPNADGGEGIVAF
jgi:6-phosphogluconolactonase (cycloisomerase 2 family)